LFSIDKHYPLYQREIYDFIYFLVFNHHLAEDILQETFLRAHQARHTYRGDASIHTWLRKIAKHLVLDHQKSKKKMFWSRYSTIKENHSITISNEELILLDESKKELYIALAQLKLEYRLAIILRKIEEFSVEETAHILEWSPSKVKNNTERGMKQLKHYMKGDVT
jgi:RNA polymerase sigma-70 factor, ECF subfamily